MTIEGFVYGKTKFNKPIDSVTITNKNRMSITAMTYGATLISVKFPDRDGNIEEITLGKADFPSYEAGHPFLGSTVGRYANRIRNATFFLNGKGYELPANNGKNSLHGGAKGFDKQIWDIFPFRSNGYAGVKFSYLSKDGEEGYPGRLEITSTYILTEKNELFFVYEAISNKETPINITNHTYWNLLGADKGNILDHRLQLNSEFFIPVDDELIPVGEIKKIKQPFDFSVIKRIGKDVGDLSTGYDHCFTTPYFSKDFSAIDSKMKWEETRNLKSTAIVLEELTGRKFELFTSQPGIQFYSGKKIDNLKGREAVYNSFAGFCLETQNFPDAPNNPNFPNSILRPGERYNQSTMLRFSNF